MAVDMQVADPTLQVHGKDQPHQSEVVVAVKMAYEDVMDAVEINLKAHQLHLSAFAAVDHKILVLDFNELSGGMPPIGGEGTA